MYITLKNRFLLECEQHYGVYSKKISSSDTHIIHSIFNMYTANRDLKCNREIKLLFYQLQGCLYLRIRYIVIFKISLNIILLIQATPIYYFF
jgi:hypothetical protein